MILEASNLNGSIITSDIFSGSSLRIKEQFVLSQILSHNSSSMNSVKKLRNLSMVIKSKIKDI